VTKLQQTMKKFDAQAEQVADHACFWQSASLLLAIWTSGGIPAPAYDPRVHVEFQPLYRALLALGVDFRVAVDARAFPI
jgi:hypothetical protein